ncbi:MAG TPA: HEPN domain-containing protein [Spirochaetota bacterium]|nr:HEPN domain-containing protein [Spirochaetota bacterium]HNT12903.1 HEPN domain-containing protein [Spirochaetota bacterium]HNV48291.1 HEPN domain-containing protein [Spirochaetota bacterium]HOS39305.1 HEPN domain-containing protein [Spirochaetota bacterium]HPI23121.1 HEPN domain-containing protein [Spirochaetota bacterium]
MSGEKYREDAGRWYRQAQADLKAARGSMNTGSHEWASFQAQQAAEKALKALWYFSGADPWGHSIAKLILDLPEGPYRDVVMPLLDSAKALDKLYIPTRYPNGLPDMIPAEVYTPAESRSAIACSEAILYAVENAMR